MLTYKQLLHHIQYYIYILFFYYIFLLSVEVNL